MSQNYNGLYLMVGRFNPLTAYHYEVINSMPDGQSVVAVTRTVGDKKNPLELEEKLNLMAGSITAYPIFDCADVLDAVLQCKTLYGATEVILYCGSDRAQDYLRLNTYTEPEGIRVVDVVCVARLDDTHSATHLRSLARQGLKEEFKAVCGYAGKDRDTAYEMIRNHYGCI